MTRVKICGITTLKDAIFSIREGADFLGFVFTKKSPRYIAPEKARKIIEKIGAPVFKVGVFVNERPQEVKKIAKACRLDFLQFHGDETPAYLKKFKGFATIKALRVRNGISKKEAGSFGEVLLLFDTFDRAAFGGTGKTFDWRPLKALGKTNRPFIVSGGLTPRNVRALVSRIHPFCVDVSSGVEKRPGEKDRRLVKKFIKTVRSS